MANICTNLFFCSTENKENLKTVENYMTDTFGEGWYCYCSDEQMVEGEFESKWSFPENFFERITTELSHDKRFICGFFPMNSAMSMRVSGCIETENGILNSNIL